MQRERLTLPGIAAFTCPPEKQQAFFWDIIAPRLAVRVTATSKSFVFEGKLNRQTIRRTIGDVKNWNIQEARAEARRLQTLLDQGTDPREQDREQAEAKARAKAAKEADKQDAENRKRYTLRALCKAYSQLLAAKGKTQSAMQTRSIFKCHVFESHPTIAETPAREITAHQIAAMVRQVAEQGKDRAAGILRSYLSAAFNAARRAPFDAKLPSALISYGVSTNPVEPVSTIAVRRGDRTLNVNELKSYLNALTDDLCDSALKLALFSGGQRMAQLLRAKVSDYDAQTQTLRLWDSKGKRTTPREHLLPLAPKAGAIVTNLIARAETLKTPLLFSSSGKTQLVETTPGKRAATICKAMQCQAFDLRDIRRTCETMLAGMGISKDTRAQLLSHGLSGVQAAHYDRHGYIDEKRAALAAWEQRLDDIATGKQTGNVVQIKAKHKTSSN
jgi:integrase